MRLLEVPEPRLGLGPPPVIEKIEGGAILAVCGRGDDTGGHEEGRRGDQR
jgi:hypothetical protein